MDIKSWILLIGTLLIVAVICHGFWTAYKARRNDMRMDIETDIPEGDIDDMVLLSGELPNGGARVTPTVGFEALRADRAFAQSTQSELPLDDVEAILEEGLLAEDMPAAQETDEGNRDAGYQPEQTSLDLGSAELDAAALEERYAARIAAAKRGGERGTEPAGGKRVLASEVDQPLINDSAPAEAPLLLDKAHTRGKPVEPAAAGAEAAANVAKNSASNKERPPKKLLPPEVLAEQPHRKQFEPPLPGELPPEQPQLALSASDSNSKAPAEPVVEFPETTTGTTERVTRSQSQSATPAAEELVVLNVIAKSRAFQGGDVLELFLRNGIKFGDMNIFHRIDPVTKANQYSIASVTEPGYFDLRTMEALEFKGLCLFMQLPCPGQATKVFTDMLTVADKLARQLDAEVCDEQYNRLTRQSTEHYRQRVAEFTRRHMSKRA